MSDTINGSRDPASCLEIGIWLAQFRGRFSGNIGGHLGRPGNAHALGEVCYMVAAARLKPPSASRDYRAVVWIGAVSDLTKQEDAGSLGWDDPQPLLPLRLKVTYPQIGTLIALINDKRLGQLDFQVGAPVDGFHPVEGWSASFEL